MNRQLLRAIIEHVLASFGVIPSDFINFNKTQSLKEKNWRLPISVDFEVQPKLASPSGQVWGCQISTEGQEVKIILANLTQEENFPEYALLVQLKDSPCYGLYLVDASGIDSEPMIACSVNGKEWIECNTYLQASFLTGMEQIKESVLSWNKCVSFETEYEKLVSFIDYHHLVYGEANEGQEG